MKRFLVALLIPLVGACGDRPDADMDFGGDEIGPDRHAMLSEDGNVKMGLTDEFVYFALSERALEEARAEMREEADKEGVEGFFGGVLEKTVGKALGFRAKYPVAEIRDIRWEDGAMRIDFMDPDRSLDRSFRVDDEPVAEAFSEEDVRAFGDAFREVKEGGGAP
ncbi:MAG: hypothetical protein GWM90_24850 [Gemmatimonadetes bacterium]|nr:hypothetical protein [Gemmatimonadota bacterium]NIQ58014.1 hypothetical protein [Gemmatimonadota bacterium]NIU78195.1 hypothetical protein [Gammaproteobacteria bacterium]NIX47186.1 hypothetical protein [Gemmatimonadota bacterium]NIY11564.1 hypothetical protein [Gemmatimonadota bacterium]